jgi:hypothetical protein
MALFAGVQGSVRELVSAGLLALVSSSCSVLATTHFFTPLQEAASGAQIDVGGRPVWSFPALASWGLCLGLFGGSQVATVGDGTFEVEVSSRELEWAVHSIGPVLPLIPNLMFGGAVVEPTLALHLHVEHCRDPVRVVLARTHLVTAEGATVAVRACVPGDEPWSDEVLGSADVLASDPLLKRGGGLWLVFDAEHGSVSAFELTLALESASGTSVEAHLPFERSQATYYVLMWLLRPGGD